MDLGHVKLAARTVIRAPTMSKVSTFVSRIFFMFILRLF